MRLRRLHSRTRQLLSQSRRSCDTAFSTLTTDNPDNIRPQTSYNMPEGEHHHPDLYPCLRPWTRWWMWITTCPAARRIAPDRGSDRPGDQVLQGKAELPPKGATIGAGNSTVCDECPRKRNVKTIKAFGRIQLTACSIRTVPARTGHPLQWARHPQRLQRPLPICRRTVHRLLWSCRRRGGLWRTPDLRLRLGDRQQ